MKERRVIATLHLPLDMEKVARLLMQIDRVFPGATTRPGLKSSDIEIIAEVD